MQVQADSFVPRARRGHEEEPPKEVRSLPDAERPVEPCYTLPLAFHLAVYYEKLRQREGERKDVEKYFASGK